ncbi:hypothetical protein EPN54_02050 [bacterium]|nr:MAG: hypothetical protein EPN54_02050 [bacterium]
MDEGINRPVIEYKSGNLRDPFLPLKMVQEEKAAGGGQRMDLIQVGSSVGDLKVQGIIWGGRFPQAIINDKVLTVGDTIGGVKLLSIDKNGITLSSSGGADNSTVSMKTPAFKKGE